MHNKDLLLAERELVPADDSIGMFDLEGILRFNRDLETKIPERVKEFKFKVKLADVILIAIPEYNLAIPGMLKNAHRLGFETKFE